MSPRAARVKVPRETTREYECARCPEALGLMSREQLVKHLESEVHKEPKPHKYSRSMMMHLDFTNGSYYSAYEYRKGRRLIAREYINGNMPVKAKK